YRGVGRRGLVRNLARNGCVDEAVDLLESIGDATVASDALDDVIDAVQARAVPEECRRVAALAEAEGWRAAAACLLAVAGDPDAGRRLVDGQDAVLALRVGVNLADIHRERGAQAAAVETVRSLVPIAERILGRQWWAPDTFDVPQNLDGPA